MSIAKDSLPDFSMSAPVGYWWLIERGLVGLGPFTQLQPWYFLDKGNAFWVSDRWPIGAAQSKLFAFARRQDNDDLACFEEPVLSSDRRQANGVLDQVVVDFQLAIEQIFLQGWPRAQGVVDSPD